MKMPTCSRPAIRTMSTLNTSRDSQIFPLPDGRILGFAEYGHPTGYPLFYFHGFPMSRLEGRLADDIGRRLRLRVITPDRPGYGLSTFQPNRRITDWPADVEAFALHHQLSSFAVLGGSGGGPYALACAHMLPREMLSAAGIVAGAPPFQAGTKDLRMSTWLTYLAATYFPSGLRAVSVALIGFLRWAVNTGPATRWIDAWLAKLKAEKREDREESTPRELRERLLRVAFEGFAQGPDAFVQEAQLLTHDWGFRFEDVEYPIRIWHGTKDRQAPPRMVRWMADRLPHCIFREVETEAHSSLFLPGPMEEILSELIPKDAKL
jgi:pimeloyl-ACP methyl ester carboxylesterase